MKKVILNCTYVEGYLRGGHLELELNESNEKEFSSLTKEEQLEYIQSEGDMVIDSYRVEDYETYDNFEIEEM